MKKLKFGSWTIFGNLKITPTIILKPKNMINIPEILAKSKKSSDLHDSLKIYRHLHISGKKIPKKGTPFGSQKPCVGNIFGKSRRRSEKKPNGFYTDYF